MICVIIALSAVFIGVGFLVTENNAKYILSGYNTMSEEERKNMDIKSYIPYFRRFHLFLGISLSVMGSLVYYFVSPDFAGIFLGLYPILAYIYFIWSGAKYSKEKSQKGNIIGTVILVVVLVFMAFEFVGGYKENQLIVRDNVLEISGSYGEEIKKEEIKSIILVNDLPEIKMEINGMALENIWKGTFKTEDGERVKLILSSANKPIILITKRDGKKIYYSARDKSNEKIFQELSRNIKN